MISLKDVALIIVLFYKLKGVMCQLEFNEYNLLKQLRPATGYSYHITDDYSSPHVVYYLSSTDLDKMSAPLKTLDEEKYVKSLPINEKKSGDSEKWQKQKKSEENENKYNDGSEEVTEERAQSYGDKYKKNSGNKTKKEYSSDYSYSKGKKSSYDKSYDSGDKKKENHKKVAENDDDSKESSYNSEEEEKKAGDYGLKKSHQKGERSKAYHNIFQKDEYKKDRIFYGMYLIFIFVI
jgi:Domain of unknown function (DUF4779)